MAFAARRKSPGIPLGFGWSLPFGSRRSAPKVNALKVAPRRYNIALAISQLISIKLAPRR
jgi:hypothetical protein